MSGVSIATGVVAVDPTDGSSAGSFSSLAVGAVGAQATLVGDAANVLAQRNGTNAQSWRLYYTFTDTGNYQRLEIASSATAFTIAAQSAGTGAANIDLQATLKGSGSFRVQADTGTFALKVFATGTNDAVRVGGNAAGSGGEIDGITFNEGAYAPLVLTGSTCSLGIAGVAKWTVDASGNFASAQATAAFGYKTGAGGTQTQITSKATGVTLSKATGEITMNGAALAADTTVSFVLTNTVIAAGDYVAVQHVSAGTQGAYQVTALAAAGSATINVRNITPGSLSEAIVLKFAVIRAATS